MISQTKVAGVILAGGRARRMDNQDKGLVNFKGSPMVSYALDALVPVVDVVFINANRSLDQYRKFGHSVISDQTDSYDGPLAGVLSAMIQTDAEVLVVIPCDSPFIKTKHLQKLLLGCTKNNTDVAVAFDGKELQPVFFVVKTCLKNSLQNYLAGGQGKVMTWLAQQNVVQVDFSEDLEIFSNINTLAELAALESSAQGE